MAEPTRLVAEELVVRNGGRVAVDRVSLEATSGSMLAIVGPNGAGKTSLLRAIAGLVPVDGRVTVDGTRLDALSYAERARRIAYVPQQSMLASPLPVERVVALGRYAHGSDAKTNAAAVEHAMERASVRPWAKRAFTALSLGEQRRVLLARALATDAPVLLLDEPDAFLDVAQTLSLFALLRSLRDDGRAIVVVQHGLDEVVRSADRTLLLGAGRTVALGPTDEALSPTNVTKVFGVVPVPLSATGYRLPERTA